MRRVPLWWAPVPFLASLAVAAWSLLQSPDLPSTVAHFGLLGAMASALLWFGGWPRRRWVVAGVMTFVAVCFLGWVNAKLVVHLHGVGGVPAHWLLDLSAAMMVVSVPAGLIAGMVTSYVCIEQWLRR